MKEVTAVINDYNSCEFCIHMDMPVNTIVSGASCLIGLMVLCCTTHDRLRVYIGLDATRQAGQVIIAN